MEIESEPPSKESAEEDEYQMNDGSLPERLLVVNWSDDTERNRASQVINSYNSDLLERPQGTVRMVHQDVDVHGLADELLARLPSKKVHLFELDEEEITGSAVEDSLAYEFDKPQEELDNLLNFIITNHRGRMTSPSERRYEITSRKGRAEVWFETGDKNQSVKIYFEGSPESIDHLKESFRESLEQAG